MYATFCLPLNKAFYGHRSNDIGKLDVGKTYPNIYFNFQITSQFVSIFYRKTLINLEYKIASQTHNFGAIKF